MLDVANPRRALPNSRLVVEHFLKIQFSQRAIETMLQPEAVGYTKIN